MLEVIMIFECVIILMSLKHQKEQEILKADPESFNQNRKKKKIFLQIIKSKSFSFNPLDIEGAFI